MSRLRPRPSTPHRPSLLLHRALFRLVTGVLVGCLSATAPAVAQVAAPLQPRQVGRMSLKELMDQEVVSAASRYDQKTTEAASTISIISADEIRQFGYRTIQDVLNVVRGFYTTYDRNYSYVGVRGISPPGDYNARVLVLLDGHRLNENVYDGAYIGTDSAFDLSIVERVEVIHGPGSSMYGSNAVFAVVNFVTRTEPDGSAMRASVDVGSWSSRATRVSVGHRTAGGTSLLVSASRYDSRGQAELFFPELSDAPDGGVARRVDADHSQRAFLSLSHGPWSLRAGHASREKQIPTAPYGTIFNDPRTRTMDERQFASLKYRTPDARRTVMSARVAFDRYAYDGDYPYADDEAGNGASLLNRDIIRGLWLTAEAQASRRVRAGHHLVGGLEFRDNLAQDQRNFDERVVYLDAPARSRVWGVFAQDEWKLARRVSVVLGVRHDEYESFGGTTNPRLAALITAGSHTTVKLIHGRAFRAPNVAERSYTSVGFLDNAALQPETTGTYELGVEHLWTPSFGGELRASIAGYANHVHNAIAVVDTEGGLQSLNVPGADAHGVETELLGRLARGITARGSYTWQRAVDDHGLAPANAPTHLANVRLYVPFLRDRVGLGIQSVFVGARLSTRRSEVAGSTNTSITAQWHNARGVSLTAMVSNAFDAVILHPASEGMAQSVIRQDGRTWRLSIGYAF